MNRIFGSRARVRASTTAANFRPRAAAVACLGLLALGCGKKEEPAPSPAAPAPAAEVRPEPAPAHTAEPEKPSEAPAPSGAPMGKLAANSQCAGVCTRATELGCSHAADCERTCHNTMDGAPCSDEMKVATACMLARPISDWQCSPDGLAAIKEGVCVAEQEAVGACVSKMLGGGSP